MNTKEIKRHQNTNIRKNSSVFWQVFRENSGLKRNKGVITSCLVGLFFPPLLVGGIFVFTYRAIKTAIKLPSAIRQNNENQKLYSFSNNFSLEKTTPVDKEIADKLLAFYTNSEEDKNVHIISAEFISPKNNVFEAIKYNEETNTFTKERVSGLQNGEWVVEKLPISKAEIVLAKAAYEKHNPVQEQLKPTQEPVQQPLKTQQAVNTNKPVENKTPNNVNVRQYKPEDFLDQDEVKVEQSVQTKSTGQSR